MAGVRAHLGAERPVSKSRSATSNFLAWTENFTCLKLVVTSLSLGMYAPTW